MHHTLLYITRAKRLSILLLALGLTAGASAQTNGSNSPYSRYGYGLLSDRAQGFNKAMAGTGYALRSATQLNAKNPASYAAIDSLTFLFDTGFSLQNGNFTQGDRRVNAHNAQLDYLSAGFRLAPNLGLSLGLLPFSTIGYNISLKSDPIEEAMGEITQREDYTGDGGVHEVYVGAGWMPLKGLSVGANVGYLWGDMTHTILATFSNNSVSSRRRQYATDVRTWKLDLGAQYAYRLDKKNLLSAGVTYSVGHDIHAKAAYYDQLITAGSVSSADTLITRNAMQLPHTLGFGVAWEHNKQWRVAVDYTLQKWSSVTYPGLSPDQKRYEAQSGLFDDLHRISLGAEFVPRDGGVHRRDHIRYRLGAAYTTPYARVNGQKGAKDYLVSLGAAFPIMNYHNNRSFINIAAQYEHVQPSLPGMVKERYLRLSVGITFNERWFKKWKVE